MSHALAQQDQRSIDVAIDDALLWLDQQQDQDGYWVGMLESNSCMEAEWILAFHILGYEYPDQQGLCRGILSKQRADGAWETFHNAPAGDINTTVEVYAALRCAGYAADTPELVRARRWIEAHGGLKHIRVFTRYWLALLGEWPWEHTPNLPPEIIRLPNWAPFNIYQFASWARATLVPLCVLSAKRWARPLPASARLDELFPNGRALFDYRLPRTPQDSPWERFFLRLDRVLHRLQDWGVFAFRRGAVERCLEWIIRHQDADGAWGGIQPPWIYNLMALRADGYPLDHPVMAKGLSALQEHWTYTRGNRRFIQASESPIWDTLLSMMAMQDAGRTDNDQAMQRAMAWVTSKENDTYGDWAQNNPHLEPGGWAFERANRYYPDIDDTAVALIVLNRASGGPSGELKTSVDRARDWVLGMQSDNGGWGAFDRNNHHPLITKIPFCDFGEVLDPPSVDVTAHVLEGLSHMGVGLQDPHVQRAMAYIKSEQEADGSWFGRWGVNHVYGTGAVLPALQAIGEDMQQDYVHQAASWLVSHQNADGGWGETCSSYMQRDLIGRGPSTASQTAWGLMGLLAVDVPMYAESIERGLRYLLNSQRDGTWHELEYTGTGFPGYGFGARLAGKTEEQIEAMQQGPELARAFMINYNMYRHYFPLMALARARSAGIQLGE